MLETLWNSRRNLLVMCGLAGAYWVIQLSLQTPEAPRHPEKLTTNHSHALLHHSAGTGIHEVSLLVTLPCNLSTAGLISALSQEVEGVDTVYEVPENPKGVLLLFHGCQHSSTDWWMQSEHCPECIGKFQSIHDIAHDSACQTLQVGCKLR